MNVSAYLQQRTGCVNIDGLITTSTQRSVVQRCVTVIVRRIGIKPDLGQLFYESPAVGMEGVAPSLSTTVCEAQTSSKHQHIPPFIQDWSSAAVVAVVHIDPVLDELTNFLGSASEKCRPTMPVDHVYVTGRLRHCVTLLEPTSKHKQYMRGHQLNFTRRS